MALAYSIAGTLCSLSLMLVLKKSEKFSMIGVSVAGAVMHNIGQILMAVIILGTREIIYYLPVLAISGIIAGVVIGIVSAIITERIKNI